jgi:hypothetical protein
VCGTEAIERSALQTFDGGGCSIPILDLSNGALRRLMAGIVIDNVPSFFTS